MGELSRKYFSTSTRRRVRRIYDEIDREFQTAKRHRRRVLTKDEFRNMVMRDLGIQEG